ncbi:class A beta-lactamase [Streptomyces sp. NPDC088194]|uniref:class A beta-lactamase n=1 Tax=Streptomyces sp. NPDC088194 TaxID=3154931 RepID=UPI00344B0CEF
MRDTDHRTWRAAGVLAAVAALLAGCGGGSGDGTPRAAHAAPSGAATSSATPSATPSAGDAQDAGARRSFAELERRFHAHLGLYALDTGSGRSVAYQADRRFAHCSTIKVLAAGTLLKRAGDAELDRVVTYPSSALVPYSPITSKHAGQGKGMTLRAIMAAALRYSDNTAENLMLDRLGGPAGLQEAVRAMGDAVTHVDRPEPALNDAVPGDTRDTSTARALGTDLRSLLLGGALPTGRRALLTDLMVRNTTGGPYVRAGAPSGWKVADKTGSGDYGTRNDIAVLWPPHGAPVVISVLTDRGTPDAESADPLIANATTAALTALGR